MVTFNLGIDFATTGASKMDSDLKKVEASASQAEAATENLGAASRRLATDFVSSSGQIRHATDTIRYANNQMSNLSAQWFDIGVMMAAGQNPIQLALQQGTQVAQVFQEMGNKASILHAIRTSMVSLISPITLATIGIIALGSAAVNWFFSASEKAKTLSDKASDLRDSLESYSKAQDMANLSTGEAAAKYGQAATMAGTYFASLEAGRLTTINQQMKALATEMSNTMGIFTGYKNELEDIARVGDFFNQSNVMFGEGARNLRGEIIPLIDAMQDFQAATNMSDRVDALERAFTISQRLADLDGSRSEAELQMLDAMEAQMEVLLTLRGKELDAASKSLLLAHQGAARLRAQGAEMQRASQDMVVAYEKQAAMGRAIAEHGKDSYQVEGLRRKEALATAEAFIAQNNLSGTLADNVRRAAEEAYNANIALTDSQRVMGTLAMLADNAALGISVATGQTYDWEYAMSGVAMQIRNIGAAIASIGGGMISLASMAVERQALATGKSVADARIEVEKFKVSAKYDGQIAGAEGRGGILGWAESAALKAAKATEMSVIEMAKQTDAMRDSAMEAERAANRKGKSGAGAAAKAEKALAKETLAWQATIDPMQKYEQELAKLEKIKGRLSDGEFEAALRSLNVELADSLPMVGELADAWGDFVASGFQDFESFTDAILSTWKQTISDMIAEAAKNQIVLNMRANMGGTSGVSGSSGSGGSGGFMGQILGFGGSVASGATGLMTALTGAGGGFAAAGTYLSSTLSTAFSSIGAFGAAVGSLMPIIGAISAVVSIGKKLFGRELKDVGVAGSFSGGDFEGSTYKYYKGGLLRSNKTSYTDLDSDVEGAIERAFLDIRKNVKDMAKVLDLGSESLKSFAYEFKISTAGLSEDEIMQALQEELEKAGDGMAELVLGTKKYSDAGETALETMTRLSSALTAFNGSMDLLGNSLQLVGLKGADIASNLAKLFDGPDGLTSAVSNYWSTFYSEERQRQTLTRQTATILRSLGVQMPKSRAEYMALIDSIDLTDKKNHKLYATLIQLSGAFDQILPEIDNMTVALERVQNRFSNILDRVADRLQNAIDANRNLAEDWRGIAEDVGAYLVKLRGTASALISPQQARMFNRLEYLRTLSAARGGDMDAAGRLTGAAENYLSSVRNTSTSRFQEAWAQARVMAQLGQFQSASETEAQKLDRIATLQQRQLDLITRAQELLAAGKTLSEAQLEELKKGLGDLDKKILKVDLSAGSIAELIPERLTNRLSSAIDDLREAIERETARQEHNSATQRLNSYVNSLTKNKKGNHFVDDADLAAMAKATGINTEGMSTNEIRSALARFDKNDLLKGTVYDPTGALERAYLDSLRGDDVSPNTTDPYQGFRLGYGWRGSESGTWHQTVLGPLGGARVFDVGTSSVGVKEWFKDMIEKKKFPAFARGGRHRGGPAYIGEDDLELVAPSRVYSPKETRDMLDNTKVVEQLKQMKAELAEFRKENRALQMQISEYNRKISNTQQEWNIAGVPTRPV